MADESVAVTDTSASDTAPSGDTAPSSEPSGGASAETSAPDGGDKAKAEPWFKSLKYRRMNDAHEYEDEEFDSEDSVRARLSDDYEEVLKVNKEERRVPRHHMRRLAQLGWSANDRFEQAKQIERAYEARQKAFADDPYSALDEADEYKFSNSVDGLQVTRSEEIALQKAIQFYRLKALRDSEDPMHRSEYVRLERERLERLNASRQSVAEKQRVGKERAREMELAKPRIEAELKVAFKSAGIPDNDANRSRIAAKMRHARESGYDMTLTDAAHFAREEHVKDIRKAFDGLSGPQALALLGPVAKMIREAEVKAVQAAPAAANGGDGKPRDPSMKQIQKTALKSATETARGVKVISFSKTTGR